MVREYFYNNVNIADILVINTCNFQVCCTIRCIFLQLCCFYYWSGVTLYILYSCKIINYIYFYFSTDLQICFTRIYVHLSKIVLYLQENTCALNKFFISFNLILCVIISIISILPTVQEYQPRSGLLQSSVLTLYVVYLTWSGISNSPGRYK